MSGFSTSRSGIDNVAKGYGSILRGYGPPVPKAGVVGDLYIDNMTFQLFEKRSSGYIDDWGHYLFTVPANYRNSLKWFGQSGPDNSLGRTGDYFLQWGGYDNYGMNPTIWGPKLLAGWPENGEGSNSNVVITSADVLPIGLLEDGAVLTDTMPGQLIAIGLLEEYVIPLLVTASPNDPVTPVGVPSSGMLIPFDINPLYTAEDTHAI
jgi:hypothetical protein